MTAKRKSLEVDRPGPHTAFVTRRWLVSLSLLIVVLIVGVLIALNAKSSDVDRGTDALIEAFSNRRFIEPRLSGGFRASEFRAALDDMSGVKTEALERARELITDAAARGDSSADLAYARLLLSNNEKLPEALKYLRSAEARAPESAEAHNDLGVCFIQQGKLEDAIDEFEVALKHRADMPEALFNRALSYQHLLLTDAARSQFNRAAEVERDDSWVVEIKRRIQEMSSQPGRKNAGDDPVAEFDAAFASVRIDDAAILAAENSESFRTHALRKLSVEHLRSAVDGDPEGANRALSKMDLIGSALIKTMSDSSIADLAKYLRDLPVPVRRTELLLINDYVGAPRSKMTEETVKLFERLEKEFRATGNCVFEALSAFRVADHYYYFKRFKKSLDKLKRLLSSVESREWSYDRARFLNVLALETSRLGQDSLAIKYFQQAVSLCGASPQLEAKIHQYMSVPYIQIGDIDGALERLRDSTRLILENAMPLENLAHNYSQIADIYSRRNRHDLALLYADQAINYSEQARAYAYAAEYSSFVAVEQARLGKSEESAASLKRAFDYLDSADHDLGRDVTEARMLTNAIEVASRSGDTQRALDYYDRAAELAKLDEGNALLTIDLLRARADAYLASGKNENARADLIRAVSEVERYRANIATSDQRSHFLDASHRVFDELISLDIGASDRLGEAFEWSERSRARALLEEISLTTDVNEARGDSHAAQNIAETSAASVSPNSLADVRSDLPEDLMLLEYSVTNKGTYVFLITRSGFKLARSPATTEILDRLTSEYISGLRTKAPVEEVNQKALQLYDYLIKPVAKEIQEVKDLCIVPDKSLHFLPFTALVDGSGRYLFQSHSLSYAPSASVLIRSLEEDQRFAIGGLEKILAVGNPRFNAKDFPNLRPLEDAETEARRSSQYYAPESVTLRGAEATEPAVRSGIKECDVAHLGVHCLVDNSSPWLAALVLGTTQNAPASGREPASGSRAGATRSEASTRSAALTKASISEPTDDPNDGLLYLKELYGMKLPRTRLVVLSACQSGLGQYYRGEGVVSLVRPFLAAGVPTVVASLWSVDSKATSDLMIEFHRQRKLTAGLHAAEALRRAQIELARTYEHPFYWAPFIVVGGRSASR
jgi:CHAT domain-containing protein/tetratricopeptide (TPR) repeat protein